MRKYYALVIFMMTIILPNYSYAQDSSHIDLTDSDNGKSMYIIGNLGIGTTAAVNDNSTDPVF